MTDVSAADEAVEETGAETSAPRKRRFSGKKIFIFLILPAVLVVGVVMFGLPMLSEKKSAEHAAQEEESHAESSEAFYYDLPDLLVNLNTQGKQPRYLKLLVSLEIHDEGTTATLDKLLPRIIDRFQVYLRELRTEDISGSAGVYRLKEELLSRVNKAIEPAKVSDVLFREMLVQ
jgi:flagellar FliL protein